MWGGWRIQGLPIFSTPISQERVKLRTSNLAGTFTGSIRTKAHKKLGERGVWAYPGASQIFEYSLAIRLSQEWVKLRTSNFVCIFIGSMGTTAH